MVSGTSRHRSPRRRMPFNLRNEGTKRASMRWRVVWLLRGRVQNARQRDGGRFWLLRGLTSPYSMISSLWCVADTRLATMKPLKKMEPMATSGGMQNASHE